MFDPFIIVEGSLRDSVRDGVVIGFEFQARCGYYRRLILSMVEDLEIAVDGTAYPREAIELELRGKRWTFAQMEAEYHEAWEFGEPATIRVLADGLAPGEHALFLREHLRISYMPRLDVAEHEQMETLGAAT